MIVDDVSDGQRDEARRIFNQAIRYGQVGQYEAALADYTESIRLNPKRAENYGKRSAAYRRLGEKAKAKADCDKAQALSISLISCF